MPELNVYCTAQVINNERCKRHQFSQGINFHHSLEVFLDVFVIRCTEILKFITTLKYVLLCGHGHPTFKYSNPNASDRFFCMGGNMDPAPRF